MAAAASAKTPWHLWVVGTVALLFNAVGVFDFVMNLVQGPAYLARAGMTPEQVAHYQALPAWMMVVWATGVFGAFGASILLLMRRRLALPIFIVSLLAFLVSQFHTYVLTDAGALMGAQMAITGAVIAVLLLAFGAYSHFMALRGVLR